MQTIAALYGVVIGITQRNSKVVLAYSSVSQLGQMAAVLGAAAEGAVPAEGAAPVAGAAAPAAGAARIGVDGVLWRVQWLFVAEALALGCAALLSLLGLAAVRGAPPAAVHASPRG